MSDKVVCYNCRKSRHIHSECPEDSKMKQLRWKGKKPKAMICTWSDEEEEEEEDEDTTSGEEEDRKLCLMAKGDEENDDEVSSPFEEYSLSDWEEAYAKLLEKYDNVRRENRHLKKKLNKNACLERQVSELKKTLDECVHEKQTTIDLKIENENLLKIIDELKLRVQKIQEESVIATEKYDVIRNVNVEHQKTIEKLQKK